MVNSPPTLTASLVEESYERIRSFLPATRLLEAQDARGRPIFLKLETEQPTGSFKVRGALSNLLHQPDSPQGFVTASAGNHGLGLAWAVQHGGRREPVFIFVPGSAPQAKIQKLRGFPVDLRVVGQTFDDAERAAHEFERKLGGRFIHAYDDPWTAAGQGTMAIEIQKALGSIGTLVVPVGGGGLISGNAVWLAARHPRVKVVAVQPTASPALSESIRVDRALLDYPAEPTLADGLSGGIGEIVFAHRNLIDEVVNVSEERIRAAISHLHHADGVRAEASAAISRAAVDLEGSGDWPQPIVCVITGGNIDDALFAGIVA